MNTLSIVNIIVEEHVDIINELAEILGMGANSLSIKLMDESGNIYYGCHSWWEIDKYITFKDHYRLSKMGINIDTYKQALTLLHEFLIDTRNYDEEIRSIPSYNWENALKELNLTRVDN